MSLLVPDIFFALVFLFLIIILLKVRRKIFADNCESYRYTLIGVSVLFVIALVRLFGHQDIFATVPFLSEPMGRDLTEAVGIITGIALMMAGVSIWLPVKRRREREDGKGNRYLPAAREIERTILETSDIPRLLELVPEMICGHFGFLSSALYVRHSRLNRYIISSKHIHNPVQSESSELNGLAASLKTNELESVISRVNPDHCLYLNVRGIIAAAMLFWKSNDVVVDADTRVILDRIAGLLSHRLTGRLLAEKEEFYEDNRRFLLHAKNLVIQRSDIKGIFHEIQTLFRQAIEAKYCSLAISDKSPMNMRRFTAGINRRILLEDGAHLPVNDTQIETVMSTGKNIFVNDIRSNKDILIDSLFLSCGQKCLMTVPIINYGRVIGVLTLGHPRPGYFRQQDLVRAELMAMALAPAIEGEIARNAIFERDRYLGAMAAVGSVVENSTDIDSILKSAAGIIMENVGTTMVRITMLSRDRMELVTRALSTIRGLRQINTDKVSLSKELTPWHRMVMQENRLLLMNQSDPETSMDRSEARALVFDGLQSALIVPIAVNGLPHGFITLGEMRHWDRFSYDSSAITFCKEIAAKIAYGIKISEISRIVASIKAETSPSKREYIGESRILSNLKSSVTNLQGSIDLLKLRDSGGKISSEKALSNIEESSNRIISIIREGEALVQK